MTGAEALIRSLMALAEAMEREAADSSLSDAHRSAALNVALAARAHYAASCLLDIAREKYGIVTAPVDPDAN